jgi:predicted TIM-barrel fold metal-dependent hydrolase
MLTPGQALAGVEQLGLDEQALALFLGRNAERVFRLDKGDA